MVVGAVNRVLPAAAAIWRDDDKVLAMDQMWDGDERKLGIEELAANMVRSVGKRKLLDIGCGSGRYARIIRGWRVYLGIDSAEAMIELASVLTDEFPKRKIEVIRGDALAMMRAGEIAQHDLALCIQMVQHYECPFLMAADVLANAPAKHVLITFDVHDREPGETVEFKIGWEGEEDGSNIASRSVHRDDVAAFLRSYEVVATKVLPVWWHPDAKYLFALIKKGE